MIPTGKEVKLEGTGNVCRSFTTEGTAKVAGTAALEVGAATKPEGPAGANFLIHLSSETVWTHNGLVECVSTWSEVLKLALGVECPHESGTFRVKGPATYALAEEAKMGSQFECYEGVVFQTQNFNWNVTNASGSGLLHPAAGAAASTTLELGSSTVRTGEWFGDLTVRQGTSLIVIQDEVLGFFEGTKTYYRLWVERGRPALRSSFTIENELALNTTNGFEGVAYIAGTAGKTVTLAKGCVLTTNGSAGTHAQLKSTSVTKFKIKLAESVEVKGHIDFEHIEVEGGTLYAPEGTDASTGLPVNVTNVGIIFESKGATSYMRESADTLAVADTGTRTVAGSRTQAEGVAVGEAQTRVLAAPRAAMDAVAIAEASGRVAAGVRAGSDPLAVAESAVRTAGRVRGSSDPLMVAEAATRALNAPRAASDAAAVGESVSAQHGTSRFPADTVDVAEAQARIGSASRAASDPVQLSENAARQAASSRAPADSVTVTESATRSAGKSRAAAEALSVAEVVSRTGGWPRASADLLAVGESASARISVTRGAAELLVFVESVTVETSHEGRGDPTALLLVARSGARMTLTSRGTATFTLASRGAGRTTVRSRS